MTDVFFCYNCVFIGREVERETSDMPFSSHLIFMRKERKKEIYTTENAYLIYFAKIYRSFWVLLFHSKVLDLHFSGGGGGTVFNYAAHARPSKFISQAPKIKAFLQESWGAGKKSADIFLFAFWFWRFPISQQKYLTGKDFFFPNKWCFGAFTGLQPINLLRNISNTTTTKLKSLD